MNIDQGICNCAHTQTTLVAVKALAVGVIKRDQNELDSCSKPMYGLADNTRLRIQLIRVVILLLRLPRDLPTVVFQAHHLLAGADYPFEIPGNGEIIGLLRQKACFIDMRDLFCADKVIHQRKWRCQPVERIQNISQTEFCWYPYVGAGF